MYALTQSIKETVTPQPGTVPRPQKPLRSSSIRQEPLRFSRVIHVDIFYLGKVSLDMLHRELVPVSYHRSRLYEYILDQIPDIDSCAPAGRWLIALNTNRGQPTYFKMSKLSLATSGYHFFSLMIQGNAFRITYPLRVESTDHRWVPLILGPGMRRDDMTLMWRHCDDDNRVDDLHRLISKRDTFQF